MALDSLGRMDCLDQSSLRNDYLSKYDSLLDNSSQTIVIIGNSNLAFKEAELFATYYSFKSIIFCTRNKNYKTFISNLNIHIYDSLNSLMFFIFSIPTIHVCIEHSDNYRSNKTSLFASIFPFLTPDGHYFMEDVHSFTYEKFNDYPFTIFDLLNKSFVNKFSKKSEEFDFHVLFSPNLIDRYTNFGKLLDIRRSKYPVLKKIQKFYLDDVCKTFNILQDEVIFDAKRDFTSLASITTNTNKYRDRMPTHYPIPKISLREYSEVTCYPGNLAIKDDYLIPEFQRRTCRPNSRNIHTECVSEYYIKDFRASISAPVNYLKGSFLYFDHELDGHFGHIVSEQISKLWAWDIFSQRFPQGKVLVGARNGKVSPLFRDILLKYGIPESCIVPLKSPVHVEHLLCPSQLYEIPFFASPKIKNIWDRLRSAYSPFSSIDEFPKKIFLTRADDMVRPCRNKSVVEQIFSSEGYQIISPEKLSFPNQIALFARAQKIGGFGGSNTLNAIFATPGITKTIVKSETYDANNDFLISSIKGDNLNICFCPSEIQHSSTWNIKAFMSPFKFDEKRDSDYLHSVI